MLALVFFPVVYCSQKQTIVPLSRHTSRYTSSSVHCGQHIRFVRDSTILVHEQFRD